MSQFISDSEAEQLTPKPIHASDLTPQIASLPYLAPTHPLPTKTHTCYMSAGTADKTEGLDWDKVLSETTKYNSNAECY